MKLYGCKITTFHNNNVYDGVALTIANSSGEAQTKIESSINNATSNDPVPDGIFVIQDDVFIVEGSIEPTKFTMGKISWL